ncbi:hypothetical protein K474DRAFT_1666114 [Panus rudis PR-1116 ss-1]|nr:hypothetical protein K474DRAFT_1666114 [Panus rudis PR-1116 ss-1]
MTNAKRLSSGASFLDSLTRLASRLRYYLPFRSNAMAELYKPLFDNVLFQQGEPSHVAVDSFEQLAGGWLKGNNHLDKLVPTYIQIRKERTPPWHEFILADVVLRDGTEGAQRPLGLLVMERSFLHDNHSSGTDKNNASSHPPQTAAQPAPANTGGSTTTTAPPLATTDDPAGVSTTDDHTSIHTYPPGSATANTTAADNNAQKKDSFWSSRSVSDVASQSSYYLAHSSQAISTPAHDTIKFLPMLAMDGINEKSLPVLEMRLKNTNREALAAIPAFAILKLLVLTYEYTKNHLNYTIINHQCYDYAIHAFRCAQVLLDQAGIYQEREFDYSSQPQDSHMKRGHFKFIGGIYVTRDPGLNGSMVQRLKTETEKQVEEKLKAWTARGNISEERTKREEAQAAAEEAQSAAEEERKQKEEAKRAAEEAKRAAEEERKQKEEAQRAAKEAERAAEEERKKREALEEQLARLMARYAPTQHK